MSASPLPPFCSDCRKRHTIMIVLRAPTGAWQLCGPCWCKSKREAEAEAAKRERRLADKAKRERQTHLKRRVGSHQDESPVYQDEIFEWSGAAK